MTPSAEQDDPGARPRRGRPSKALDTELRDRLLQAAMSAFIEKGFAHATTADIARRAGVSKREIYNQFTNKTEIFTATILSRRHLILDLPRPEGESLPPLDALRRIFRLDLQDREAAERDALMNLVNRESMLFPELNTLLYDTGIIRSREFLMEWLSEQMDRGVLPRHDTECVAGMLMDVVFGALLPRRQSKGAVDRKRQARDISVRLAIILEGLSAHRAAGSGDTGGSQADVV